MCGFGLEIMAECHREAWCWKDEFQRSYTLRILHQIPAQFHGHDVPTETQLKEHMAAPSFKTLASARPCTIQHGCTVICYTENVNRAANCFIDHKLPISKCLFSIKNKKRGTRPPKKLDTRLDDDKKVLLEQFLDERLSTCNTDVDELRAVLQNAAAHVFGKKKRVQDDWFMQFKNFSKMRTWTGIFWEGALESWKTVGSDIELKKQSGTLRRRTTETSMEL